MFTSALFGSNNVRYMFDTQRLQNQINNLMQDQKRQDKNSIILLLQNTIDNQNQNQNQQAAEQTQLEQIPQANLLRSQFHQQLYIRRNNLQRKTLMQFNPRNYIITGIQSNNNFKIFHTVIHYQMIICMMIEDQSYDEFIYTFSTISNQTCFNQHRDQIIVLLLIDGKQQMHPTLSQWLNRQIDQIDQPKNIPNNALTLFFIPQENIPFLYVGVKQQTEGKLSQFLWLFKGFCEMINPNYVITIQCGTQLQKNAIENAYNAFDNNEETSCICPYQIFQIKGYYQIQQQREQNQNNLIAKRNDGNYQYYDWLTKLFSLFFCLQRAQLFQSIFHNLQFLNQSNAFGFIQELPSSVIAFRWESLRRCQNKTSILDHYLKIILEDNYLQEDKYSYEKAIIFQQIEKILALEIYFRDKQIRYLPSMGILKPCAQSLSELIQENRFPIMTEQFAYKEIKELISNNTQEITCKRKFFFVWYT